MVLSESERSAIPPSFDYDAFELPESAAFVFRLNSHTNAQDLPPEKELQADIKRTDVIIVESVTSTGDDRWLGKISSGNLKEYQGFRAKMQETRNGEFGKWLLGMAMALYDTRTPAITVDAVHTQPFIRRYQLLHEELLRGSRNSRTNEDVLELKGTLERQLESVRDRDQFILGRLAPRLGQLATTNKLVRLKQQKAPLEVSVFYGSMHRSLHDALAHKVSRTSDCKSSTRIHEGSETGRINESVYAQYLRGLQWSDESIYRYFSQNMIAAVLVSYGHIPKGTTMAQLQLITDTMLDGLDYTAARELADDLKRIDGPYEPFAIGE